MIPSKEIGHNLNQVEAPVSKLGRKGTLSAIANRIQSRENEQ
jgi:hypothetical protein